MSKLTASAFKFCSLACLKQSDTSLHEREANKRSEEEVEEACSACLGCITLVSLAEITNQRFSLKYQTFRQLPAAFISGGGSSKLLKRLVFQRKPLVGDFRKRTLSEEEDGVSTKGRQGQHWIS